MKRRLVSYEEIAGPRPAKDEIPERTGKRRQTAVDLLRQSGHEEKGDTNDDGEDDDDDKQDETNSKSYTAGPINLETGQRAAFPGIPEGVDLELTEVVDSGIDFLVAVRTESKRLPHFVAATRTRTITKTGDSNNQAEYGHLVTSVRPFQLDPEYQSSVRDRYDDMHARIDSLLAAGIEADPDLGPLPTSHAGWKSFILQSDRAPTLELVASLDMEATLRLLDYCRKWVQSDMSPLLSQWLFALLVRLPQVLLGDDISALRELCKVCLKIVQTKSSDLSQQDLSSFTSVIYIVGVIFGQKDLIMDDT